MLYILSFNVHDIITIALNIELRSIAFKTWNIYSLLGFIYEKFELIVDILPKLAKTILDNKKSENRQKNIYDIIYYNLLIAEIAYVFVSKAKVVS